MYYDDPYDPNLPNDYDDPAPPADYEDDARSATTSAGGATLDTRQKYIRKLTKEQRMLEKGYAITKTVINNVPHEIAYYHTSYYPGSTIRNAVTGIYQTPHHVGKATQDLYFKVVNPVSGDNPHQLFYDSPEQFEGHFHCQVSDQVRRKWNERVAVARQREQERYNKEQQRGEVVVR